MGSLFGYVQIDILVSMHLSDQSNIFAAFLGNTNVSRHVFVPLMHGYAEMEGLMSKPQRRLLCSFESRNGTIITPLYGFFIITDLLCTKVYQLIKYTPVNCFINFVQSAVDARRQRDENPYSNAVGETMTLLANSSHSYQIKDRSFHPVPKYLNDEEKHPAISRKLFKSLVIIIDQLYEAELIEVQDWTWRAHQSRFFWSCNVLKWEFCSSITTFFTKFCIEDINEEMEIDT